MLRNTLHRFSFGGKSTANPFAGAALRLCQLQKAHREIGAMATDPETGVRRNTGEPTPEQQEIEQQFLEELEKFRPIFHASSALVSSRMYSAKLYTALRYFQLEDDPLFKQLATVLGNLNRMSNDIASAHRRKTVIWNESMNSNSSNDNNNDEHGDEELQPEGKSTQRRRFGRKVVVGHNAIGAALDRVKNRGRPLMPEFSPQELPAPHPDDVGEGLPSESAHVAFGHRGHWVLREPGIAASRDTRRMDPW